MKQLLTNRERIANAAWELFWQQGYYATSIADIAKYAGLPKGSIYNYFSSKDALLVDVINRLRYQYETELRLEVLKGTLSPSGIVKRLINHYYEKFEQLNWGRGDPLASRLSELADTKPELTKQLERVSAIWRTIVAQKIWAYATVAGIPELTERAESLAAIIYSAVQGALLQMKVSKSDEPLLEARNTLVQMIASYVGAIATGDVPVEE